MTTATDTRRPRGRRKGATCGADGLTDTQREVLLAIAELHAETGAPPSFRELVERFGWASTQAVVCHLRPLVRKGFLPNDKQTRARALVLPGLAEKLAPVILAHVRELLDSAARAGEKGGE